MLVVGLTGGIGSGKSEVSRRFEDLGVPVIDTDRISRDLVSPGSPALDEIAAVFGPDLLTREGALDRKRLRAMIFAREQDRLALEDILHPRIRQVTTEHLSRLDAPYAIIVVPLLLETRYPIPVDRVLVVDAPEETRIRRVARRDAADEQAVRRILARQAAREVRLAAASDVITNDGELDELDRQVQKMHRHYLELAAAGG